MGHGMGSSWPRRTCHTTFLAGHGQGLPTTHWRRVLLGLNRAGSSAGRSLSRDTHRRLVRTPPPRGQRLPPHTPPRVPTHCWRRVCF